MGAPGTKACDGTAMVSPDWQEFATPDELADALADRVASALTNAIDARGVAVLAVSGGSTPKRFFEALSHRSITWDKVVVTLVDERFVPETDERSNAALVKAKLLTGKAAAARFVPLFSEAANVDDAA